MLEPLFSEIIIAGWPEGDPLPGNVTAVQDNYKGVGPLAGIEAALAASHSKAVFVFGSDMPWLSEELIGEQVSDFLKNLPEILAARSGGLFEP
ncbi:hypothetical protein EG830_04935, partial [bacterium]|nr:hypothetical protein [bacterium]